MIDVDDSIQNDSRNFREWKAISKSKKYAQNVAILEELKQLFQSEIQPVPFLKNLLAALSRMKNDQIIQLSWSFPFLQFLQWSTALSDEDQIVDVLEIILEVAEAKSTKISIVATDEEVLAYIIELVKSENKNISERAISLIAYIMFNDTNCIEYFVNQETIPIICSKPTITHTVLILRLIIRENSSHINELFDILDLYLNSSDPDIISETILALSIPLSDQSRDEAQTCIQLLVKVLPHVISLGNRSTLISLIKAYQIIHTLPENFPSDFQQTLIDLTTDLDYTNGPEANENALLIRMAANFLTKFHSQFGDALDQPIVEHMHQFIQDDQVYTVYTSCFICYLEHFHYQQWLTGEVMERIIMASESKELMYACIKAAAQAYAAKPDEDYVIEAMYQMIPIAESAALSKKTLLSAIAQEFVEKMNEALGA